ncbi:xanthine dehydrogenase family protein molybdopterin-binding subunit [Paradesulfitobacterium ferrireducens]|uniref:xanthine dehydrogenase family protein molybdopterin-binding subunit n=1 Tax=Paradesulfitobacterium ferrireducens TaxID=2816476 RepID=UPI001A8DE1C2|nr:molybdopterin cofactor-binding domain-containing protein [Paradesulfitobacterium ferrireducens]
MSELNVVGKSVKRYDALEKVTGKAPFVYDMFLPDMLWAKVLRSPYPHAKIIKIDTTEAEKLPGVVGILTAADLPKTNHGAGLIDEPTMAIDRVRFVGEPVVAVAAESEDIAQEALTLIDVEYEELPGVFDPEIAMQTNPPSIIHPDLRSYSFSPVVPPAFDDDKPNVYNHYKIRHGNLEAGFQQADVVIENRFTTAMMQHCQMEPHVAVARAEVNGDITVWTSAQTIYGIKQMLCDALQMSSSKVRVIVPYVGGGYGGKVEIKTEAIAVGLAMKTRRPVRFAFTREEVFTSASVRHPSVIYVKDGVKKDGTLVAREVKVILNGGAYSAYGYLTVRNASFGAVGTYKVPNFKLDSYGVYTNLPIGGAFRGFGSNQVCWAIECQMDRIADHLNIDPVELRRKNLLSEGEINVSGETTHSYGTKECLEKVVEEIGYNQPKGESKGPWKRGRGIGLANKYSIAPTSSCAIIKLHDDGYVELRTSADEMGQGSRTVLAQIAAEEFNVEFDKVKVVAGDTLITPYDQGSISSRTTYNTGNAVRLACEDAKRQLFKQAAKKLEAPPEKLETANGRVFVKGSPDRSIAFGDLFIPTMFASGKVLKQGAELLGKATWYQFASAEDKETGQGTRVVAFYIHGATGAEVEVNEETGEVRVIKAVSAFDMGKAINPELCEQQIEGGIGMGIGAALYEEMAFDNGAVLNPNFMDYKIPTSREIPGPSNVKSFIVEANHPDGPFGAKGIGEGVTISVGPAIQAAINDAVGIRLGDMPMTRERVFQALSRKKA